MSSFAQSAHVEKPLQHRGDRVHHRADSCVLLRPQYTCEIRSFLGISWKTINKISETPSSRERDVLHPAQLALGCALPPQHA